MVYLTFAYEFNAYHKLWNRELSSEENVSLFGKCANPSGHGHLYRLEITLKRRISREQPFVLSRKEISNIVEGTLSPRLAFCDFNAVFGDGFISSGENIARSVWRMLKESINDRVKLVSVRVIETEKNSFTFGDPASMF